MPHYPARQPAAVLTIAGSDSGGGAGIQADLKAFAACGVHGMAAVTAITAQNTVGVDAVEAISPAMIRAQVEAVVSDIGADAIKVGMLGEVGTIEAVAEALDRADELSGRKVPVVVDPVMVAESGARLLADAALSAMIELILPRATVLTPNLPEARVLAGALDARPDQPETGLAEQRSLARDLRVAGPDVVVVTGGHSQAMTDLYFDGTDLVEIPGERHPGGNAHGSGCTHSSLLAARLACGDDALAASRIARHWAAVAVGRGLTSIGAGPGPVDILGVGLSAGDESNPGRPAAIKKE